MAAGNSEANAKDDDTMSIAQRKPDQTPISIHVLPAEFDEDRALELVDRYCDLVEAGEHPPLRYVAALFSEVYERVQARRAEAAAP